MSNFTWSENGLIFNGYTRAGVKELQGLLIPSTKASSSSLSSSDRAIVHPKAWWEAQVAFYGLKKQGTMEKCKQVLRHALELSTNLTVPPHITELSKKLQKNYKAQIAREEKQKYSNCTTDSAKADMDPKRFLSDHFKKNSSIVFKEHVQRLPLQAAADSMNLQYMSVDAPTRTVNPMHMPRYLIIAKTREDLLKAADNVQAVVPSPAKKQKVSTSKAPKTSKTSTEPKKATTQFRTPQFARKCGITPAALAQMQAETQKGVKETVSKTIAASMNNSAAASNVLVNINMPAQQSAQQSAAAPSAKPICVFVGEWSIDSNSLTNTFGTGAKRFRVQWDGNRLFATFEMGTLQGICLFTGKPKANKRMEFTWRGSRAGRDLYVDNNGLHRGHFIFHIGKTLVGEIFTAMGHYTFDGTWIGKVVGEAILPSVLWQDYWERLQETLENVDDGMQYEVNGYSSERQDESDDVVVYDSDDKDEVMYYSDSQQYSDEDVKESSSSEDDD